MKNWMKVSLLLCSYGFFRELRPNEPFVIEFLAGEWRNITYEEVNRIVYPIGTYAHLALLVVVFLITDMLRYKPIIVISAIIGIVMYVLLLWTSSIEALMAVQGLYGFYMASEVAYYTYIYAKVDKRHFQRVTGQTRSAILAGKCLAAVIAQLLISFNAMNFRELNYITFGTQIVAAIITILLPSVAKSLYFYAQDSSAALDNSKSVKDSIELDTKIHNQIDQSSSTVELNNSNLVDNSGPLKFSFNRAFHLLWKHFKTSYSNKIVIQWSVWWALAMAGYVQIIAYIQLLWQQIDPHNENLYNGGAEAIVTLLGAVGAISAGYLNSKNFTKWDLWILTVCTAIEGALILLAATTRIVWIAYLVYIVFGTIYNFMITIASATIAKELHDDSFALIFGINTLLALCFQTILTVVFISENGFALDPRGQHLAISGYFFVLAAIYLVAGVISTIVQKRRHNKLAIS